MTFEQPNHIGVVAGTNDNAGRYLITAEYKDGYRILGVYKSVTEANKDLPFVRAQFAKRGRSRPDPINESPSYRAAMMDAGRGRLLR